MIISASRRTDIPAFYSEWFMNRVREGYCLVPNPFNPDQVARVSLKPGDVDAIVFWSKDPVPLFPHLGELDRRGYRYYFLFTLNGYGLELEPNLPPVEARVAAFRELSVRLGPERVIWRYDPIVLSNRTGALFHEETFAGLAAGLAGATRRVVVSIVDYYRKTERRLARLAGDGYRFDKGSAAEAHVKALLKCLREIAVGHGIAMQSCAEETDLRDASIAPGSCVDGELLHRLWGVEAPGKDPNQRAACGCVVSKDIGVNDTCLHGCRYCYATRSDAFARARWRRHDPHAPALLAGAPDDEH